MHLEPKHWKIVTDILGRYPYTFYAFGSRVHGTPTQFSDLDLCFFDEIPGNEYIRIEEDFEHSDLPYKVDLIDWNKCDATFKKIIGDDMICVQAGDSLLKVERIMYDHFCYLPGLMGFNVIKSQEATIINCGLGTSEYNIVCDMQLSNDGCVTEIQKIIEEFHGQASSWWIGPSSQPLDLGEKLLSLGLKEDAIEYLMVYHLKDKDRDLEISERLNIKRVKAIEELHDFIKISMSNKGYSKNFFEKMGPKILQGQEILFVGYQEDKPVESGQLYCGRDIAGVFNIYSLNKITDNMDDKDMLSFLVNEATCNAIGLSVCYSDINFYASFGFKVIGQFKCYVQGQETT